MLLHAKGALLCKNLVFFWRKSFGFQENYAKIPENSIVLQSRILFRKIGTPLDFNEIYSQDMVLHYFYS